VKSKSSSARRDRLFDKTLLVRAREVAIRYRIVLTRVDDEYFGQVLEMPGVMNDGKTPDQCIAKTVEILTTAIATLLEQGQVPPSPSSDQERNEQVNVRLTKLEKLTIEEAARSRGFRGLSDYMRASALGGSLGSSLGSPSLR